MSDVHQSGTRTPDGRFVIGHRGGPGRPRIAVLDQHVAPASHSFEVAIELAAGRTLATVKLRLDGGK
jgi:hypothetical protein